MSLQAPSMDQWLREAKADPNAGKVGMYLVHNGTVRETAKAMVREGEEDTSPVSGMDFSYDHDKVQRYLEKAREMDGIYYIRAWLNEGHLDAGEDIMYILFGGDTRPHVIDALHFLVDNIKGHCVIEQELYSE